MLSIINIAAYRFVRLPKHLLTQLQTSFKLKVTELDLKGTLLLSEEGINLFISGKQDAITSFQNFLNTYPYFINLEIKKSFSNFQPFKKMLVKLKKEIISFGIDRIQPDLLTAPYVTPEKLNLWLEKKSDLVLLDTRNSFEVKMGSFKNALDLNLKKFRDFPNAIKKLPKKLKKLPIVTFCTGGIRCEKAAAYLLEEAFTEVYQLKGGILNYFEKCGKNHFEGSCFVFDDRESLTSSLEVSNPT
ncbi:rhodanese-like domain-containing protein [Rickettsiella grylli]|uniref:Rhodanese domain protein n=2 Tax=Rickettsiella grylli TaxID=59196 RepID=A8PQC3_9COXI|nr:rhodanese-like domain-containing protein [Rickettsiella grylli]EDP45801.1 rhodanese domain protein [Rickettsiella grylli]